ncbi:MAG TPA: discoidin domain-containing protein [Candidatus Limnocylindrales bacterium]|nr:discoidin domain-containing protein [Candidatus Limnocylindrales bacterium]
MKSSHLTVLLIFTLFTLGLTYPLVFHLNSSVFAVYGDPLLTTWILAWDVHKLFTDPQNLFQANIFYPYKNVLAYSENLLASSLFAAPILLLSQNPILAHNGVFLLSFILSGFGTYLLVRHLTHNPYAGLFSGIIFAFGPYKFSHLGHLQLLTTQWIPFCFLFLHRLLETHRWRDLFLFWLFFILQALSSSYYALFLSLSLGIWLVAYGLISRRNFLSSLWSKLGGFVILSVLVLYPVSRPYFKVQEEMGFTRTLEEVKVFSADLKNYLGVPHFNKLYGKVLVRFAKTEAMLFPGTLALLFAGLGILFAVRPLKWRTLFPERGLFLKNVPVIGAYGFMVILAGILSLGPQLHLFGITLEGPYGILYHHVPGFKGLRVPSRWGMMVSFGLSVLAGYGVLPLLRNTGNSKQNKRYLSFLRTPFLVCALLSALLVVEYDSTPLSLHKVPVGEQIPEVYQWLAKQEGDFPIFELPLQSNLQDYWREAPYVYFSTYHWKKLINGYSGFSPPLAILIHQVMETFPDETSIQILQRLGTRYLIIHSETYPPWYVRKLLQDLECFDDQLILREKFGEAYLYEINGLKEGLENRKPVNLSPQSLQEIRVAHSNYNSEEAKLAVDGNLKTRWTTKTPQKPDMYFELELENISPISGVLLNMGSSMPEYPRQFQVEVSTDGTGWEPVNLLPGSLLSLAESAIQTPKQPRLDFVFAQPIKTKFIRISQTGQDKQWAWSIHEIQVYK